MLSTKDHSGLRWGVVTFCIGIMGVTIGHYGEAWPVGYLVVFGLTGLSVLAIGSSRGEL